MSTEDRSGENIDDTDRNWIRANCERLKRESQSEAPDAWVFERLLQSLDDEDRSSS